MAAWLAYLKSRLLLPPDPAEEGPSGDELAAHLAFQLERLEAMRDAAARLMARDQLGRDVFARGEPQAVARDVRVVHTATLVDLMRAYARIKTRDDFTPLHLARGPVYTMEQALERMRGLLGTAIDWVQLAAWLPEDWAAEPARRRSATAASFAAALELVKAGRLAAAPGRGVPADLAAAGDAGGDAHERDRPRGSSPTAPSPCRRCPSRSAWSRRCSSPAATPLTAARDRRAAAAGRRRRRGAGGARAAATRGAACSSRASATPGRSAPPPTSGS